jgi:hypothetical protein
VNAGIAARKTNPGQTAPTKPIKSIVYLEGLAAQVPADFQFGFKVTDEPTGTGSVNEIAITRAALSTRGAQKQIPISW